MRVTRPLNAAILAVAVTVVAACSTSTGDRSGETSSGASGAVSGTVVVYAAASLQATFERLAAEFRDRNPAAEVKFSFGGSSGLLTQLAQGAPADVFASADTPTMDRARSQGVVRSSDPFATNVLTIATAPGNPKGITSLTDLTRPGTSVVVCAAPVPCGAATVKVTTAADVRLKPVSEEDSVSGVLAKVRHGQADAGLVYRTDVRGARGAVGSVDFPQADGAVNVYPIAPVTAARNARGASAFIDFVRGPQGRAALADAGFGAP
ncbi:molybdate ABC transporter substrate-binding protein [Tsukamurella serpentis]